MYPPTHDFQFDIANKRLALEIKTAPALQKTMTCLICYLFYFGPVLVYLGTFVTYVKFYFVYFMRYLAGIATETVPKCYDMATETTQCCESNSSSLTSRSTCQHGPLIETSVNLDYLMVTCTVPCRSHGLQFLIGDNIHCLPDLLPSCYNSIRMFFLNISLMQIWLNNNYVSCYAVIGDEICYSNNSEIDFITEQTSSLPSTIVTTESRMSPMIIRSKFMYEVWLLATNSLCVNMTVVCLLNAISCCENVFFPLA